MFEINLKYFVSRPVTSLLILLNILFFGAIALLFFVLNNKPQAPHAVIAPHITMGKIILKVNNFKAMENFYTTFLGMQIISHTTSSISLGYNKNEVLQLLNTPKLVASGPQDPGLDQIAMVFNTRPGLARVLQRVMRIYPQIYAGGTSRGAIGEAFYVTDPAGNSLELYYDTDPSTWPRSQLGNVEGDALPIDIQKYIQQYAGIQADSGMKMGHMQMRIGDITQGKQFYLEIIGFYANPSLLGSGQSVSMSDGFYHHDLVINQTQGYDGDNVAKYLGLFGFTFSVPNTTYLKNLENRLTRARVPYSKQGNAITFSDPWGIQITVGIHPLSFLDNFF